MSLASSLSRVAVHLADKPGVIVEDKRLSYLELNLEARHLALSLLASGVRPGDRVALHMYNGVELVVGYFACFYAGAIAVPINTRMKPPEIQYVIEHSGSSIYLGQSELFHEISKGGFHFRTIRRFVVEGHGLEPCSDGLAAELPAIPPDRPAVILYTSGSTARPKGVVHTHRSARNAAQDFVQGLNVAEADVITIITPMVHSAGFFTLLATVEARATALIVPRFDTDAVLDAIARCHGTHLVAMPFMYRALIAAQRARPRDMRSGRHFFCGSDAVQPVLQSDFAQCFGRPLHEVFGTTETGLVAINWSEAASHVGSFGRSISGVDVAVVDANGDRVSVGTEGEMLVRSESNMAGYWNDQAGSERTLERGWFHTGDLVCQDGEGYLWFRGRKKEVIVRGGSNISPQEVEAVLYEHAGVREAGVIGPPDEIWGQRVIAFVARRPGVAVGAGELIEFVGRRLAAYKTPEEIIFLDDLPKNATGKVLRRALLARYLASRSREPVSEEALV